MILTSDYHTHTVFSHGKGTILENAMKAKELGLKELGISDHGFSHSAFGIKKRKIPQMKRLCEEATKETGVKILLGVESNITGEEGSVDLKPDLYGDFDIFLAGVHKFILYKFKSMFSIAMPNLFHCYFKKDKIPDSLIKANTRMYINVIKNNPIDILTHLNFCCFADAEEVAKVASDYGTYLELNSKKVHLTDEELYKIAKTGVNFIISSDAHTPSRVGEISLVEQMLNRINLPLERIKNIDGRLPQMRFKAFKEKYL